MNKEEKLVEEEILEETLEETTEEVSDEVSETEESLDEREAREMAEVREKEKEESKDAKITELNDRLLRQMAEFDNFRRRSEKEKAMMFDMGAKSIIEKILPVVDNFERGLGTLSAEEISANTFADGMDKVYKSFMQTLLDAQVKPIEAVGNEFNPEIHNAVMHGEDESLGENIVAEELQKGYLYKDMVVRPSMVKVVN